MDIERTDFNEETSLPPHPSGSKIELVKKQPKFRMNFFKKSKKTDPTDAEFTEAKVVEEVSENKADNQKVRKSFGSLELRIYNFYRSEGSVQ